ncbi:chondroitin sulfate synthase 2-like [Rhinoraja longicauda]
MRRLSVLSWLRPAGPVAVGISLGFTLSLLSTGWVDEPCPAPLDSPGVRVRHANSVPSGPEPPGNPDTPGNTDPDTPGNPETPANPHSPNPQTPDNLQPRIIPYKAATNKKPAKKTVRTRYISTELGMREQLLVGVLTSKSTLNTLGVAVNRTLAGHTDKLLFFTGTRGRRVPHGMYVVTHGDERPVWNMYQTVRHVYEHHASEYDWFYFTPDNTYTQGDRLRALVDHMSIDTDLYMGRPEQFIGGDGTGRYCRAEFGFLLSRQLLTKLQPHLDSCRTNIISSRHDEWLGRCVLDYLAITCTHLHQGLRYRAYELGEGGEREGEEDAGFRGAMTVHPVLEPVQMFLLHKRFTQLELEKTYRQIQALQHGCGLQGWAPSWASVASTDEVTKGWAPSWAFGNIYPSIDHGPTRILGSTSQLVDSYG